MSKKLHLLPEDHKPRFLVCGHFLHCLPAEICYHLLQEDIKDPRALARKADELWWQNSNMVALNALSYSSDDQEVEDVFAVSSRPASHSFSRAPSHAKSGRSTSSRRSSSSRSSPSGWFWYHRSHGEEAKTCKVPVLMNR